MEQVGKVIRTQDKMAEVQIRRTTACGGNCSKCGGCFATKIVIWAKNTAQAQVGQFVKLNSSTRHILSAAFILYILPVFFLIGSYVITEKVIISNNFSIDIEITAIAAGTVILTIYFFCIRLIDKYLSKKNKLEMEITKIIQ